MSTPPVLPSAAIDYPTSDGKPLAEIDARRDAIRYACGALRLHYRDRANVYVSADLRSHDEEHAARLEAVAARQAAEARVAGLEARLGEGR